MEERDSPEVVWRTRLAELALAHRKRPRHHGSFLATWAGALFHEPRPAARAPLPKVEPGQLGVTFVGHATVLLRYERTRILTDPNLVRWLLGLRRAWEPGFTADECPPLDLVLVSHAHHDHLVVPTLAKVATGATCVVPPRCADLVGDLGFARVVELPVGESYKHGAVEVVAVPAQHWGTRMLGDYRRRGYCGYVIRGPGPSAYFAGDTAYFSGFAEIGRRYQPDVALLPIGAYTPRSFRRNHMSPLDAVYAFEDLGAKRLVPIHFGSYALALEPLDEPARWMREIVRQRRWADRVSVLDNGQSVVVTA